jgi:NAD(P)-dependent dehydrogenase (short-subunit alcohol dehydrogenase family)
MDEMLSVPQKALLDPGLPHRARGARQERRGVEGRRAADQRRRRGALSLHSHPTVCSRRDQAAAFPVPKYDYATMHDAFELITQKWPDSELRVAFFNIGAETFKGFLDVTEADIANQVDSTVYAAYSFAREAISRMKDQPLDAHGKRGTVLFQGATASMRGNVRTSAFAPGKFALRALTQSLAKEFHKQNIHVRHIELVPAIAITDGSTVRQVAHTVIDGQIATNEHLEKHDEAWATNPDIRLQPESIANVRLLVSQLRWSLIFPQRRTSTS